MTELHKTCDICGKIIQGGSSSTAEHYRVIKYCADHTRIAPHLIEYDICPSCFRNMFEYCEKWKGMNNGTEEGV